jgi:dihydrofolate synthase / folylpolyglutamate synthase
VAVIEVGLGGRWDATNVVDAPVAVITNIGLDHTKLMGEDRTSIAREKSGIVKPAATLVSAERDPRILAVIEEEIAQFEATTSFIDKQWHLLENKVALGGRYFSLKSSVTAYEGLFVPLHGAHQGVNAGTAIEAVTRFLPARTLDDELILEGLANTKAPGRIETLRRNKEATVVLDVAHNPDGLSALASALVEEFAFDRIHFVFGVLADKDYKGMLAELARVPAVVYATAPKGVSAVPARDLSGAATDIGLEAVAEEDAWTAVQRAVAGADAGDLVCVTGSHYVVGEVRGRVLTSLS